MQMNEEQRKEEMKRIKRSQERDKFEELELVLLNSLGGNFGLLLLQIFQSQGPSFLSLSGMKYNQQEFSLLFKSFEHNSNIRIVSIIRDQLDTITSHALFSSLRANKSINKLVL